MDIHNMIQELLREKARLDDAIRRLQRDQSLAQPRPFCGAARPLEIHRRRKKKDRANAPSPPALR